MLTTIVTRAVQISETDGGVIYEYDDTARVFDLRASHSTEAELIRTLQMAPIPLGEGAIGQAAASQTPVQVPDTLDEQAAVLARVRPVFARLGYRSLLAVPLLLEQRTMGGLVVWRKVGVPPNLPVGKGDEQRLTQVLTNLVGNAIKFTETGEVGVQVNATNGAFMVAVSDTGIGISEADQQTVFDEFQQADSSSTRQKGGTGLGLAIAKKIIEMHNGRIWVESSLGQGSTFRFTPPVRVEQQKEVA